MLPQVDWTSRPEGRLAAGTGPMKVVMRASRAP